jgi:hypothetical protein
MSKGSKPVIRPEVFWFLGIWAILMVVWTSDSYLTCKDKQTDQIYSQQQEEGSSRFLFFTRLIWTIETRCTGTFIDSNANSLIALFTIVLAISTILLWRETERLAEGADDQAEKMRQSIREQRRTAFASIVAARAAKRSASAARDALKSDRAWITFNMIVMGEARNSSFEGRIFVNGIGIAAQWKNTGRSPAQYVTTVNKVKLIAPGAPPPIFEVTAEDKITQDSGRGVGELVSGFMQFVDDADSAAFRAQTQLLVFYSRVIYFDLYEPNVAGVSETCLEISYMAGRVSSGGAEQLPIAYRVVGSQNRMT